jgi:catechol 2,3-dioxygenase-like lactoylglutathione lyase family enzyme
MGIIKVQDVEYVSFRAPDLARMREFLCDFGLTESGNSEKDVLRMRGLGHAPFVHKTRLGPPGFSGLALRARSIEDLVILANSQGVAVKDLPPPEQGRVVTLTDPNGFTVEVVAGIPRTALTSNEPGPGWNTTQNISRPNLAKRIAPGASSVLRLGHVVLVVNDVAETWQWWRDRFGLLMSDEVRAPNGAMAAAFIRCDKDSEPADHHSLNFAQIPGKSAGFHHAAFEVANFDDLMVGHERLKERGYTHSWGIGRHILGSQVFDYWRDPWGHLIEHWTDGDFFAADAPVNVTDIPTMLGRQWGPPAPEDFV